MTTSVVTVEFTRCHDKRVRQTSHDKRVRGKKDREMKYIEGMAWDATGRDGNGNRTGQDDEDNWVRQHVKCQLGRRVSAVLSLGCGRAVPPDVAADFARADGIEKLPQLGLQTRLVNSEVVSRRNILCLARRRRDLVLQRKYLMKM